MRVTAVLLGALTSMFINQRVMAADPALVGTWQLIEFQSSSDTVRTKQPDPAKTFEMTLGADGRASMQLDCNRASGTWRSTPGAGGMSGQLLFGPIAGTRALCRPPNLDEFLGRQWPYVRSYLLRDNNLHMSLMADGGIISWQRLSGTADAPFAFTDPDSGGPRNWQVEAGASRLNLRMAPSISSEILRTYRSGTVLDNLGCQQAADRTWCDVQELGGGPRGYVAADYLKPAVSPNGLAMFGRDYSALRAGEGKFDATGSVRCANSLSPVAMCDFAVSRSGGGYASVVIKQPSGQTRIIFFRLGRAIGASTSEADNPGPFSVSREGDESIIRLGDERYEIPDAVVLGG